MPPAGNDSGEGEKLWPRQNSLSAVLEEVDQRAQRGVVTSFQHSQVVNTPLGLCQVYWSPYPKSTPWPGVMVHTYNAREMKQKDAEFKINVSSPSLGARTIYMQHTQHIDSRVHWPPWYHLVLASFPIWYRPHHWLYNHSITKTSPLPHSAEKWIPWEFHNLPSPPITWRYTWHVEQNRRPKGLANKLQRIYVWMGCSTLSFFPAQSCYHMDFFFHHICWPMTTTYIHPCACILDFWKKGGSWKAVLVNVPTNKMNRAVMNSILWVYAQSTAGF